MHILLLAGDGTQCVAMPGWAQPAVGSVEPNGDGYGIGPVHGGIPARSSGACLGFVLRYADRSLGLLSHQSHEAGAGTFVWPICVAVAALPSKAAGAF